MAASDLQNDIDYMKTLAEDGRRGPLRNGATLFWAGTLFALASVAQYVIARNLLPQFADSQGAASAAIWFGTIALFTTIAVIIGRRPKATANAGNRAARSAWTGVVIAIVVTMATLTVMARTSSEILHAMVPFMAPSILILYGVGWWVSAAMNGGGWLRAVSAGCFATAPLVGIIGNRPEQMLAYAACLILFATIPGFVLMRGEKA